MSSVPLDSNHEHVLSHEDVVQRALLHHEWLQINHQKNKTLPPSLCDLVARSGFVPFRACPGRWRSKSRLADLQEKDREHHRIMSLS